MAAPGRERRRQARHQREDLNVALACDGGGFVDEGFVLHDISRGGLCLQMPLETEVGRELQVRLAFPGGALHAACTVRWVEPDNLGSRCGLEFRGLGFCDSFRLKSVLEPRSLNLLMALDRILPLAVFTIAALTLARYWGFALASWQDVRALELPPAGTPLLKILVGMFTLDPGSGSMLIAALPSLAVLGAIGFICWLLFRT